jgi:hypothetical protein
MSDNSCENNENNTKKNRRNKKLFYSNERDNIFNQLKKIMDLDNTNTILLVKLHDNMELKKKLIELNDDIKRYYRCSTWGYFVSINNGFKGDEITLLKSIFKDHDYKIFSKDVITEYNGVKKRYTQLFFSK